MVVIKLIGGLGNQMFQYASAKALALHTEEQLVLDKTAFKNYDLHDYGLHHFNIDAKDYKAPNKFIRKILLKLGLEKQYIESSFRFNPDFFKFKANRIVLSGYFQSEHYFSKYRNEVLKDFEITSALKQVTKVILKEIKATNSVSIHIRRGDYLQHEVHNTSKDDYYRKAMCLIESKVDNPTYFVFSDDMKWVKANFTTNHKTVYVDFNDAKTSYEDMALMSKCKHNIIANSSFSWWSAWLNTNPNKLVIAPEQWFNGNQYDYTDVVPNTWITI